MTSNLGESIPCFPGCFFSTTGKRRNSITSSECMEEGQRTSSFLSQLEPCAGRAAPPTFVSRRRRRFFCIGAPTPPPPTFGRRAAEGLPLSGIFSYCIFHLLDLIAIYFKNQKITVELIDCKLQVATKCRSLNSYLFILCIAYYVT